MCVLLTHVTFHTLSRFYILFTRYTSPFDFLFLCCIFAINCKFSVIIIQLSYILILFQNFNHFSENIFAEVFSTLKVGQVRKGSFQGNPKSLDIHNGDSIINFDFHLFVWPFRAISKSRLMHSSAAP